MNTIMFEGSSTVATLSLTPKKAFSNTRLFSFILFFTIMLCGELSAYGETLIVAYSSDTTCYPIDDTNTKFSGVKDTGLQKLLIQHNVWVYYRPYWDSQNDSLGHCIYIANHGDIRPLFDTLRKTGRYYKISLDSFVLSTSEINDANKSVKVYPNPARDRIFFESDIPINRITIYDCQGRKLLSQNNTLSMSSASNGLIGLHAMPSGYYLVEFDFGNAVERRRIVVTD